MEGEEERVEGGDGGRRWGGCGDVVGEDGVEDCVFGGFRVPAREVAAGDLHFC